MWVASIPPCVATTSVEYVQWGGYAAVCGRGERSHGVEHGISDPPMMEVQVKVFSQIKKQFVLRRVRVSLWSKLGNTMPKKKVALADMGAMVCIARLDMFWDLGLQKYVMEKTKIVVRRVKRSVLALVGALTVDISADGKTAYQIIYVTEET